MVLIFIRVIYILAIASLFLLGLRQGGPFAFEDPRYQDIYRIQEVVPYHAGKLLYSPGHWLISLSKRLLHTSNHPAGYCQRTHLYPTGRATDHSTYNEYLSRDENAVLLNPRCQRCSQAERAIWRWARAQTSGSGVTSSDGNRCPLQWPGCLAYPSAPVPSAISRP